MRVSRSSIGYKARVHMTKGIKRREKAVHAALNLYNTAACAVAPPRPTITFNELTEYAYLANFDFLRHSEHGAQDAEWSRPANRRCVELWQRVQRAKEEIVRLNVEIRRVLTHIRDKESFLSSQHAGLMASDPNLARILLARLQLAIQANQNIKRDLEATSKLTGFSGSLVLGTRAGSTQIAAGLDVRQPMTQEASTLAGAPEVAEDGSTNLDAIDDSALDQELSEEAQQTLTAMESSCYMQ
jgi:hypothetical protein